MKKKFTYDGKSRPSNDTYKKRWFEIFGEKQQEELKESYEQSKRNKEERDNLMLMIKKDDDVR